MAAFQASGGAYIRDSDTAILTYVISGLSGLGDNVDLLNLVFPLIAWAVCILLLSLPGMWFTVFAFSLLGHLSQIVFRNTSLRVERE